MEKFKDIINECLNCPKPMCVSGCPARNNIPLFISLAKEEKFVEALSVIKQTSTLPSICSLVCPYDKQCQGHCVKNGIGKPVNIHEIEQYITLLAKEEAPQIKPNSKKIALIGSGPSSLACAEKLAIIGYKCDIYDKYDIPGGILTYGIPDFVLNKEIVAKKIGYLKELGINFYMKKEFPKDITINYLKDNYDAIFLGFGASIGKLMNIPGEELKGVVDANYFLERTYRNNFDDVPYNLVKNVVVIGGGNTAIDAARRAVRYYPNAKVSIIYRRSENEMPARKDEYERAIQDGVNFNFLTNPVAYFGDNKIKEVECQKMRLGEVVDGRAKPIVIEGSNFKMPVDLSILAVSSSIDKNLTKGLECESWGTIKVNEKMQTSDNKIFAGGDNVSGPSLVVSAMVAGIKASQGIDEFLKNN